MSNYSGKTMMVLGGLGPNIYLVEKLHQLGMRAIVVDNVPNSPAKALADETSMLSLDEVDAIVKLCREKHVDGILHGSCGFGESYYPKICEKLGFPCLGTSKQGRIFGNKELFKTICVEYGIPIIESYDMNATADASWLRSIEFPVIVKPADGSGSKGVLLCRNEKELLDSVEVARGFSHSGRLIAEKYMTCDQVNLSMWVQNGRVVTSVQDRMAYPDPERLDAITHMMVFPSQYTGLYYKTTDKRMQRMLRSLGFQNSVLFAQAFVDGENFRVFDPGFRFTGCQEYLMLDKTMGINLIDMCIDYALTGEMSDKFLLGDDSHLMQGKKLAVFCYIAGAGKISQIKGLGEISEDPAVFNVTKMLNEGDTITRIGTAQQTIARIHVCCDSGEELAEALGRLQGMLSVEDEHGNEMLWPGYRKETYWKESGAAQWLARQLG